jgi:hypothetical protein
MKIFGHNFLHIADSHLEDLLSLEREQAVYTDHWIDGLDDFRHVRIPFTEDEVKEFVRSMKAFDLFAGSKARWARDVRGIPKDIANRADQYHGQLADGTKLGPPWHCAAGFMGHHIETLVCGFTTRRQILEEHGIASFLSTIRRAADALTPAIRCFTSREKGLVSWRIRCEDDARDLLYAMLRASMSDIKREEPIPSRACTSKVADLHSHLAKTLIEVKWVGKRGQWKRLVDEVYVDVQTYGRHPDCRYLVFFILDDAKDIPDPHLVEQQLSGPQTIDDKTFQVVVFIRET